MPPVIASNTTTAVAAGRTRAVSRPAELLTGVLLVGGASGRFGSPKALATLEGETLAERAWRVLARFDERLAVGKRADGLPLPFAVADDGSEVRAPLAGLVAGLRLARHDLCVVLPVDCPLVTAEALERLAAACAGQAAVVQTGPLPGAYRRGALPVLERRLAVGELALAAAADELGAVTVRLEESLLTNANTEAELRALGPP
jgi:molybdenum cofactor guanylyltransferase